MTAASRRPREPRATDFLRGSHLRIEAVREAAVEAASWLGQSVDDHDEVGGLASELARRMDEVEAEATRIAAVLGRVAAASEEEAAVRLPANPGRAAAAPESDPIDQTSELGGVRLLATQMMVAGCDRDQVAVKLAEDFGIVDSDRVLDEVFEPPSEST